MFDLKTLKSALEQLESERGIPKEKIFEAIEDALAAAYKKDYGKKGQVIKVKFDFDSGKTEFYQIKTVVDETTVRMESDEEDETTKEEEVTKKAKTSKEGEKDTTKEGEEGDEEAAKIRFNPEQHILLEDAQIIKKDAELGGDIIFPLESKSDYGRIAAQTAKQVIIQRIREAERVSVMGEFEKRKGEVVSGTVQRVERGNVYIDLGRVIGIIPRNEQIPGEFYKQGDRVRAYLYAVDETAREVTLKLSRSHPQFLNKLFEMEVPEIVNGVVEIKAIAREAGSRSKIAVSSNDEHIDPVGSCVGQRGVRVAVVMSELGGEKIDVIEWSEDDAKFVERAISPGQVVSVTLNEEARSATINVDEDQYSLAIGKGGQNVRLAAKLTGWKMDIKDVNGEKKVSKKENEEAEAKTSEAGIADQPEADLGKKEDVSEEEKDEKDEENKEKKTGAAPQEDEKDEEKKKKKDEEEVVEKEKAEEKKGEDDK